MSSSKNDTTASSASSEPSRKKLKVMIDLTEEPDGEVEPRHTSKIKALSVLPPRQVTSPKQPMPAVSSKPHFAAALTPKPGQKARGAKNKNRFGKVLIFATQEKSPLPLAHKSQTRHFCLSELSLRQQFPVIRRTLDMKLNPKLQWDKDDKIIFCPNMSGREQKLGRESVPHKIVYLDALIAHQASRDDNGSWGPELALEVDHSYSAMFQWYQFFLKRMIQIRDEKQRKHFLAVSHCLIAPAAFISKAKSCISGEQMRELQRAVDEENDAAEAMERYEDEGEDSEEEAARREKEDDEHRWDDENF